MLNHINIKSREASYYQRAITDILTTIKERYSKILIEKEIVCIDKILSISEEPQRLLFRLYSRKHEWQRSLKLSYSDVPDVASAINTLLKESILIG